MCTGKKRASIASEVIPEIIEVICPSLFCVAVNSDGWPVAWEVFPGNTAQIEACEQVITPF